MACEREVHCCGKPVLGVRSKGSSVLRLVVSDDVAPYSARNEGSLVVGRQWIAEPLSTRFTIENPDVS